ncbi:hypothetical protein COCNU_02G014870 [Cocos nucifera]|uniref:Uncharacterized protein n=1 Tax=Cocos nucifera TaxID=13894 RepID=A0A8K0MXV4_COCNU|nr:hypothetical protein COCNU_02G014870 [Cocos nucifera]
MDDHRKYKKKIDTALLATKDRIRHAHVKAVETSKMSADFRSEVTKGAMSTYHLGFKECLEKMKKAFPDLDHGQIMHSMLETSKHSEGESEATMTEAGTPSEVTSAKIPMTTEVYFEDQDKIPKYHLEVAKMHVILESMGMFFWVYEMGFNICKLKAKEFFLSIDTKFLMVTDIDAE